MSLLLATLAATARGYLALLFGEAAMAKSRNLRDAADIVDGYGLLPASLVRPATFLLIAAEALLALLLLVGILHPSRAGAGAAALLLLFAGAMAITLIRGRSVACGCGTDATVSWRHVGATLLLLPVALLAASTVPSPDVSLLAEAALAGTLLFVLRRAIFHLRPA